MTARPAARLGIRTVAVTAGYVCDAPRREFFADDRRGERRPEGLQRAASTSKLCAEASWQPVLDTLRVSASRHRRLAGDHDAPDPRGERLAGGDRTRGQPPGSRSELGRGRSLALQRIPSRLPHARRSAHAARHAVTRREIARSHGVHHAYTGNVHDVSGQSTYCSGCGAVVIERNQYELGAWKLTPEGDCAMCGTRCPGVFDESPGSWGARRRPVRLAAYA